MLSFESVNNVLEYSAETGLFRWKVRRSNISAVGWFAGNRHSAGYLRIRIDNKLHFAHRLAILLKTGEWPTHLVDHINGDKADNRFENLRPATSRQNIANRKGWGTVPLLGVHIHKQTGKFCSQIRTKNRRVSLGLFHTAQEAHEAYCRAANKEYGEYFGSSQSSTPEAELTRQNGIEQCA